MVLNTSLVLPGPNHRPESLVLPEKKFKLQLVQIKFPVFSILTKTLGERNLLFKSRRSGRKDNLWSNNYNNISKKTALI